MKHHNPENLWDLGKRPRHGMHACITSTMARPLEDRETRYTEGKIKDLNLIRRLRITQFGRMAY